MGRGQRPERASQSASSLLFGPRNPRPLSEEEREEKRDQLAQLRDQKIEQAREKGYLLDSLNIVYGRDQVSSYTLKHSLSRARHELVEDADRLRSIVEDGDESIFAAASIDKAKLLACADQLERTSHNLPYSVRRRSAFARHTIAGQINSARRQAADDLRPIYERLREVVAGERAEIVADANQGYYQALLGNDSYKSFTDNIFAAHRLVADYEQVDNIFQDGKCLEDLSEQLKKVDEDQLAGELDLAAFHIAVDDQAGEYAHRARIGLIKLAAKLDLDLDETANNLKGAAD